MSYIPSVLDIKTDLKRAVMASFSPKLFADTNTKIFLANAEKNLESLKGKVDKSAYFQAKTRIKKAKNSNNPIEKRREDLLTVSYLI